MEARLLHIESTEHGYHVDAYLRVDCGSTSEPDDVITDDSIEPSLSVDVDTIEAGDVQFDTSERLVINPEHSSVDINLTTSNNVGGGSKRALEVTPTDEMTVKQAIRSLSGF